MARISIKGHKTLYKEVIEILEMLHGKNTFGLSGDASDLYYYINNDNKITYTTCDIKDFKLFTVEEFFEKYPYKIGDVVILKGDIVDGKRFTINHVFWNGENIKYDGAGVDDCNYYIHNILAFPTEEMRVAFNENFKELIDACRDFL